MLLLRKVSVGGSCVIVGLSGFINANTDTLQTLFGFLISSICLYRTRKYAVFFGKYNVGSGRHIPGILRM